jgi:hypothetical protein
MVEKLKTGDILHCTGTRLISRLIMKSTRSEVSHTAIFIEIWGQPYIVDSQKDGTNARPYDEWVKKYNYEYTVHRNPNLTDHHAFSIRAFSRVGVTAYDFESLFIRYPWKLLTGKWRMRGEREEKRMFCSEYVAWVHGISHYYRLSPKEVKEHCISNNWKEVKVD